jgi:hypothetical protein
MSILNFYKIRLQSKYFLIYLTIFTLFFTIPLSLFSIYLVQNFHSILIEKEEDQLLAKSKAISASLENIIKDRVYPNKNSKEWIQTESFSLEEKSLKEPTLQIEWVKEKPIFVFQRIFNNRIEVWRFNAEFLIEKILDSEHTSPHEIVFFLNKSNRLGVSSLIEDEFKISPIWMKIIDDTTNLNFFSMFRKSNEAFFVISAKMPTLPFQIIILKSKQDIITKVRLSLLKIGISFLLVLIFVTSVSYFLARYLAETRNEKNKLSSFVNNLPIGAAILDKDLKRIASNTIMKTILKEFPRLEVLIEKDANFRIRSSRKKVNKFVWEIVEEKNWEVTLSPWFGDKPEPEGYSIIIRDLTSKKLMFEQEMDLAKTIQEEYLPNDKDTFEGIHFKAFYKPYYQVGGDYYDFIQMDTNKFLFVMADVVGHGLQAAMMMTVVKVLFLQITATSNDYVEILSKLSVSFQSNLPSGKSIVPLHFVVFDTLNKKIDYINAGHPGLIYQPNRNHDEIIIYDKLNPVLGFPLKSVSYDKIVSFQYTNQSRFFLFTDGLMDVMNQNSDLFGEERIQQFVIENKDKSIDDFSKALESTILKFAEGKTFPDDITWFIIDAE